MIGRVECYRNNYDNGEWYVRNNERYYRI